MAIVNFFMTEYPSDFMFLFNNRVIVTHGFSFTPNSGTNVRKVFIWPRMFTDHNFKYVTGWIPTQKNETKAKASSGTKSDRHTHLQMLMKAESIHG